MSLWCRKPVVAGSFYPESREALLSTLRDLLPPSPLSRNPKIKGIVAPHAGYIYSGKIAADVYEQITIPKTVLCLCPNHTGSGPNISVWSEGSWETPLGPIQIDSPFAQRLLNQAGGIAKADKEAHRLEHAIEVHLPFIQYKNPNAKFVPIVLGPLSLLECERFAQILVRTMQSIQENDEDILVLASTDMSHFLPAEEAQKKDALALEALEAMDPSKLYNTVAQNQISMCGFIPTTVLLFSMQALGAKKVRTVAYGHSGERTGDHSSVVAYAGAIVE